MPTNNVRPSGVVSTPVISHSLGPTRKRFNVADQTQNRQIVLPGHVAVLSGELEEELPDWQIRVGPREAVNLPNYMKQVLA